MNFKTKCRLCAIWWNCLVWHNGVNTVNNSLMESTSWVVHWTRQSVYGVLRLEPVCTHWLVTSHWPVVWNSGTTSLCLAMLTLPSRCGTSPPANVCRHCRVCCPFYVVFSQSLADHTFQQCYWLLALFCPSVTMCIMALIADAGGWKLNHRVPRRGLPVRFFRHFCCRMYHLTTNGKNADQKQKQTLVQNCK